MKRLVILRGNSGSGKTTVARKLQAELGRGTMLLSQDTIRREVLHARENANHPTMELVGIMTDFGWNHGYETVVVEGIFGATKNGAKLIDLARKAEKAHIYYFDISFEETLRRHATKPNAADFGEKEMLEWWNEKDALHVASEKIISEDMSANEIVTMILSDIAQN